jgi:DNA-binding NarL/FixJ family response regulator
MTVIIADDNPSVRKVIRDILQSYEEIQVVAEACDGVEVLEQAVSLRPDAIVLDIRMPRLSGIEATKRIKALMPESKVIAMSTFTDLQTRGEMAQAGSSAFIAKEFLTDLPHVLKRIASQR